MRTGHDCQKTAVAFVKFVGKLLSICSTSLLSELVIRACKLPKDQIHNVHYYDNQNMALIE